MTKPRKGAQQSDSNNFDILFEKLEKLEEKVATKECISSLMKIINEQKETIARMEDKIAVLESHIDHLVIANDEVEQYQRRLCLRINGIDLPSDGDDRETSDECLDNVQGVFEELGLSIPPNVIDRAHRVGKEIVVKGKRVRSMIVRLTTFRHRTMIFRARKNSDKYKIKLDLTKRRLTLLKNVNKKLEEKSDSFAFCDLNCRPCWYDRGNYRYFNDENSFDKLLRKVDQ